MSLYIKIAEATLYEHIHKILQNYEKSVDNGVSLYQPKVREV